MTCGFTTSLQSDIHFNSYPHEEDDGLWQDSEDEIKNFNSHPHEEDDASPANTSPPPELFQLTSSRRGWQLFHVNCNDFCHFNSHPHEEDDRCYFLAMSDMCSISTHILTKRMTIELEGTDELGGISTHILTKRMTALFSKRTTRFIYFNSHPHEEDDSKRIFLLKKGVKFQLTSSRRGWLFRIVCLNHVTDISTHILTKRMTCPPAYEM